MSLKPYYEKGDVRIYWGDCRDILPKLPDRFESSITDPPYEIGFMAKRWDKRGISFDPATWKAVLSSLKPGGSLLSFGGSRTFHRIACAIEDAGFELRDTLMWLYSEGFPKSLDISKAIEKANGVERKVVATRKEHNICRPKGGGDERLMTSSGHRETRVVETTAPVTEIGIKWSGWGTALKPAFEPIILAMRPLEGTFAENAVAHNVAGLNIEGARVPGKDGNGHWAHEDGSDRSSRPVYKGGWTRGGSKRPRGRWPSNVILDQEAAEMLDAQTGELKSGTGAKTGLTSSGYRGNTFGASNREAGTEHVTYGDCGGASRFFYVAKAKRSARGDRDYAPMPLFGVEASSDRNDHPTCKPVDLLRYLCELTRTPSGGAVLDPFMGSGTTLVAARVAGRLAVGIELEEQYCEIAAKRLDQPMAL